MISRSYHIQHEAFSAVSPSVLTALFRVAPQIPIAFSIVQTERAGNPRHPTSTGNNQVFQPRSWHASFSSQYFELFRSWASSQPYSHGTVSSMMMIYYYSNIPHDLGKDAIKFWLETCPNDLHQRFNCQFVIESIDLILNNNTF